MKLRVSTPRAVVLEVDGVRSVRAEDASGGFGILSGHADLLTVLVPSVVSYRDGDGRERYVAVRGGVLVVRDGAEVLVATPEALAGEDLAQLERDIAAASRRASEAELQARTDAARMQIAAIRHIQRYIEAGRGRDGGSP
ncbi:MAG: F0F1 ATP synthase subunit epsilon [Magnetospirillum sp.]|nr:F0F1 ATP synthase subunit epsilon [Magnetospirillum sp.]